MTHREYASQEHENDLAIEGLRDSIVSDVQECFENWIEIEENLNIEPDLVTGYFTVGDFTNQNLKDFNYSWRVHGFRPDGEGATRIYLDADSFKEDAL